MRLKIGSYTDSPELKSERVLAYLTELAQAQQVHQVSGGAILSACRITDEQWPHLVAAQLKGLIEAVPGRVGYYRLPQKRNESKHLELEVMSIAERESSVLRLLEQGPASPRHLRETFAIEGSVVTRMMRRLADQGLVHSTGATNSLMWHRGPRPEATLMLPGETQPTSGAHVEVGVIFDDPVQPISNVEAVALDPVEAHPEVHEASEASPPPTPETSEPTPEPTPEAVAAPEAPPDLGGRLDAERRLEEAELRIVKLTNLLAEAEGRISTLQIVGDCLATALGLLMAQPRPGSAA